MNKNDLIEALAKKTDLSKAAAGKTLDALFDVVGDALKKGDKITLVGFGTFEVRKRAARAGRNPRTGETIKIAAAKLPAFKPGAGLKAKVAGAKKG